MHYYCLWEIYRVKELFPLKPPLDPFSILFSVTVVSPQNLKVQALYAPVLMQALIRDTFFSYNHLSKGAHAVLEE